MFGAARMGEIFASNEPFILPLILHENSFDVYIYMFEPNSALFLYKLSPAPSFQSTIISAFLSTLFKIIYILKKKI